MAYQLIKKNDFTHLMQLLCKRQPVIIPTDTVWGILCFDQNAIYALKHRDRIKKIVQFVKPDILNDQLDMIQQKLIKSFWPGSLTVVFNNIAYRCPDNELILKIIDTAHQALFCSSANLSGQPVITSAKQAIEVFKNSSQDFGVYDVMANSDSLPSTIVDIDHWAILRAGNIENEILTFLKQNHILSKDKGATMENKTNPIARIFLAADHSGVELKTAIIKHLEDQYQLIDLGTNGEASVNYADYGFACASKAVEYKCLGIVICGTGIGISIAANKVKGARCALLYNNAVAELAKMHNDANVIALSSRQFNIAQNLAMIDTFLASKYEAGRHTCRVDSITAFENKKPKF